MTTTVYFDLDGTLLEYTVSFSEIFARTLPVNSTDEMHDTYTDHVLRGITELENFPYERAFSAVCEKYDLNQDPKTLATDYIENEVEATYMLPSVRQLVKSIATYHQIGILTNGDGRMQRRKLDEHGLDDLVEAIVISNEVGARKPERDIFEEAKKRLPADTFVYIGDTFEEDIVPARKQGFKTVYVGDDHRPDAPVTTRGTEELATLLLPLFEPSIEE
jgi:putative hydrolase of the HAD superfamily